MHPERPNTRAERRDTTPIEEQQDINDALEGRKFLEHHLLLCPAGEPPTHISIATCLYQISEMGGVAKPAMNAIRSVAFMLEELEETQINGMVKEAFDSQMTEFTLDMKSLIEDAKDKINNHIKDTEGRLTKVMDNAVLSQPRATQTTYASVLNTPPPHADPRIAAKEGIKARQFLLEGLASTKFSHTDVFQLKTEFNTILEGLGLDNGKVRSINKLRNGGALVEMDTDAATIWMSNMENRTSLCSKIGPTATFRSRVHNLIAFNVPLGLNPEDQKHRQEVCEANSLENEVISAMRWVKPVHRRTQTQRTAHLILTFNSADAANRAITNGLYICNRRCHTEKMKREPTRCLKCQGWNHFAKDCQEEEEKCGNCTKNHRTNECPTPLIRRCVSCKTDDHASWSRDCPVFIRKSNDLNERSPENALQYIPTADPWTWTASAKPTTQIQVPTNRLNATRERPPPPKKNQISNKRYDSYIPNYAPQGDTYIPSYDKSGRQTQDDGWGEPNNLVPKDLLDARPLTRQDIAPTNNGNTSGLPAPTPVPTLTV